MSGVCEGDWQRGKLGDLLPLRYGKSLPEKSRDSSGPVPVFGSSGQVGQHSQPLTSGPTLIVGRKGTVGAVYLSPEPCWPIDTVYFSEAEKGQNLKYYRYLLDSLNLGRLDRSTAVPGLSRDDYNAVQVTVAPPRAQERIVAEIEKQFSRIDEVVSNLKRVKANLNRYKAAVLKAAVEGRLVPTEASLARVEGRSYVTGDVLVERILEMRKRHLSGRRKYKEPASVDPEGLPDLPEGWAWASLDALAWDSGYGTSAKCSRDAEGVPVLRIPNVQDGSIDLTDLKFAPRNLACPPGELVDQGDMLVIRTNGSKTLIGRAAFVSEKPSRALAFASYLIRFRLCGGDRTTRWVRTVWAESRSRRWIEERAATSAGQHNVSQRVLATAAIPVPPPEEQVRISTEVDRRLSLISEVAATVLKCEARIRGLRDSALSRSFAVDGVL